MALDLCEARWTSERVQHPYLSSFVARSFQDVDMDPRRAQERVVWASLGTQHLGTGRMPRPSASAFPSGRATSSLVVSRVIYLSTSLYCKDSGSGHRFLIWNTSYSHVGAVPPLQALCQLLPC